MSDWKLAPARDLHLSPRERNRSYQRESGLVANVARFAWWSSVKTSLSLLHRLRIENREHIPAEPSFILVANHASHLDALVLGAALPLRMRDQLFPLAAGDVFFETPAVATFAATMLNALPVWRKNCGAHAIKELRQRLLNEPNIYILFPEGGRSRDGTMKPFRPGIGMLAAETGIPIIPCHLAGTHQAFPPNCRVPRLHRIRVRIGAPRLFAEVANDRKGWEEIATTLEGDVRRLGMPR